MAFKKIKINELKIGVILSFLFLGMYGIINFFFVPFLLTKLGPSEYGIYSLVFSIVAYLTILDLGFFNTIVRYTAKFKAINDLKAQYELFGMFFKIYCWVGLIAFVVCMIIAGNVPFFFSRTMSADELWRTRIMLIILSLNLAVTFPFSIFGAIITAYQKFMFLKGVQIIRMIFNTLGMVLLLQFGFRAIALVVFMTFCNIAILLYNYWYCKNNLKIELHFEKIDRKLLKEIMMFSFYTFLSCTMDKIYWCSGQFILAVYVSTAAVAVFALALQLEQIYMSCSGAISGVFLPRLTEMETTQKSREEVSRLFIRVGRLQFAGMAFLLVGFAVLGRQFIMLWVGENYMDSYVIALLLFGALIIPMIQNIGISILAARNQQKFRSLAMICVALFSLVLQIWWARKWGAIGCAAAVAVGLLLVQGLIMNLYYYFRQNINIPCFWFEIGKMSVTPLLCGIAGWFYFSTVLITNLWYFWGWCTVFGAVYWSLFWIIGFNAEERNLALGPLRKMLKRGNIAG